MYTIKRDDLVALIIQVKKTYNNFDDLNEKVQLSKNGNLMKLLAILRHNKSRETVRNLEDFLTSDIITDIKDCIMNNYDFTPLLFVINVFDTVNILKVENSKTVLGIYELDIEVSNRRITREVKRNMISTTLYAEFADILGDNIQIYKNLAMNHNSIFAANMLGFEVEKISKFKRIFTRGDCKMLYCNRNKRVGVTDNFNKDNLVKIFSKLDKV